MFVKRLVNVAEFVQMREVVVVQPDQSWHPPATVTALQVTAGTAWVTIDDKDKIVECGQAIVLSSADHDIRISPIAVNRYGKLIMDVAHWMRRRSA